MRGGGGRTPHLRAGGQGEDMGSAVQGRTGNEGEKSAEIAREGGEGTPLR